jgi:hypothetical protein
MNRFAPAYSRLTVEEFEALPLGSFIVGADGTIEAFDPDNDAGRAESRKRFVGQNFFDVIAPRTQLRLFREEFRAFSASRQTSIEPFEFARANASGHERVTILFVRDRDLDERVCVMISRQGRAA